MTISFVTPPEIIAHCLGFIEPPRKALQASYQEFQISARLFVILSLVDKQCQTYFAKIL